MLERVMAVITGELTPESVITGHIVSDMKILGELSSERHASYNGSYDVIPKMVDQMLQTKRKLMTDDVSVSRIPVYKTENKSGGYTVIIGG